MRRNLLAALFVGILMFAYQGTFGQAYIVTNSALNVGNPGGLRTVGDFTTTGGTIVLSPSFGSTGNHWSSPVAIPFAFEFADSSVSHLIISKNGLISFDTTLANTAVNSALNSNGTLPNADLPDFTIAAFWDDFTSNPPMGSNDNVWSYTYGTAPNRQFFLHYFSYEIGASSFRYWGIALDETTNRIHIVDMGYLSGTCSGTVGVQTDTATAWMVTSPLNGTQGSPNIAMGTGGTGAADNEYYTFEYFGAGVCLPAQNVVTSNITATSADLNWTSTETSFTVQYDTAGFTIGTGDSMTVATTSASLTNLVGNTEYEYYIRTNCANNTSYWAGPYNFRTACVAFTVPFTEGFDNTPVGNTTNPSVPNCWSYYESPGHNGYGYTYASTFIGPYTAPNMFRMYNSNNTTDSIMLISPEIVDLDNGDKQVTFYVKTNTASYTSPLTVGTLSDPTNPGSFSAIQTVTAPENWQEFIVTIDSANGFNGTDNYLAFMYTNTNTFDYCYLDQITVEDIPACPRPLYPVFSNVTSSTAQVDFQSTGSKFVLEYGPCGFNQGTGTFDTVYTTTATLTGLFSNTDYEVYIQNDCAGAGNGLSAWTLSSCFRTECAPQATPLFEGFENAPAGSSSNYTTPDCWKYEKTLNGTSTFGAYSYVYSLSSVARTGSQSYRMYRSSFSGSGDTSALISPAIDSMDANYKHITFWARNQYTSTTYNDQFIIGTVAGPGQLNTLQIIDTVTMNSTTYQYYDIYLDPANGYNGTHQYIVIADLIQGNGTSTFIIDDLSIEDIPQCTPSTGLAVSNITNSTALASWMPGDGGKYDIEYGETGFTQGTGAPLISGITDSSYTMMGLTGNTCYDVYVRDSCAGNYSPWFGPITFCTPCDPQNIPLDEDFEGVAGPGNTTNPNTPDCWTYWENHGNFSPYGYTDGSTFTSPNGTYHWRFYSFSEVDTAALISPALSGLSNGDKMIQFKNKAHYTSTSYQGIALEVGTSPDYNTIRNGTAIDTVYGDYGNQYINDFQVYFDTLGGGYNGTDQYIYFRPIFKNSTYYAYNFIDDIEVKDIPACTAPWKLNVSNVTATTADVSWSSISTGDFRVEYGPVGFTPATGQGTVVSNTTSATTLTNLAPNTFYEAYVADNCDTSLAGQTGPFLFRTECLSQLSGTYTVGGTGADFADLDSAMFVLAGCGVSGPVTFNVAAGTDSTTIALGVINGSDSVNTVTIKGAGISSTTIYINSSVGAGIDLDGSDYITFEDMTIDGSNTNRVVWLHNRADHITFDNCYIMGTSNNTSSLTGVIIASGSPTSASSGGENANYLTVQNCEITGGYYGVSIYGSSTTTYGTGVHFENNDIHGVHYYAMRVYYMNMVSLIGNKAYDMTNTFNVGAYLYYNHNLTVEKNELIADGYAAYVYRPNYNYTTSANSRIVNNFFSGNGTSYGIYGGEWKDIDFFHNSVSTTGTYGFYVFTSWNNVDVRNNILVGGNNSAIYSTASSANTTNVTLDNNLYYTNTGTNLARWNAANYTSLTAWQAVDSTLNVNSVEGDPVFVANDDLRIIIGALANDAGDNTVGVNDDIFGTSRPFSGSTTVDIGAYEYEPLASDLEVVDGMLTKGLCLSTMDTVILNVRNVLGGTLDMSMTNIVADWTVTGPVNSNGTITVNSGSLAQDSSITLMATTVNLSVPGTYYLNAHINPSSYNLSPINDTLEQVEFTVNEVWSVTPESDTLYAATDTAELKAQSPYFGGDQFFITEICQFMTGTGSPTGGWPSYFPTQVDYIEITGIPGSDMSGFTLEQWTTSTMVQTYTFPANTVIGPNGTATFVVGQFSGTPASPNNYLYMGASNSYTWSSSTLSGRIIKDPSGNIIEAVGYPGSSSAGYTFPAAAGVTTADWAGGSPGFTTTSTSGMRLEGADVNGPTNWVASATSPQDPNTVNSSVSVPVPGSISGFSWSLNGNLVDTVPVINVSHANSGLYQYVATYNHPCGPFYDTVDVYVFIVGSCVGPTNLMSTANCTDVILQWDSDQATTASFIEYGPAGFVPGNGTLKPYVTSPDTITGLTPSTAYEFYLVDSCMNGVSTPVVIADSTILVPTVADFGWTLNNVTMNNADVDFDASATTNGIDYNWDYGDGNNGTGVTNTHTYSANGTYIVTLSVTGPCVNDTHVDTIEVEGIGIDEGMIGRTMNLFPNPTNGQFRVEFEVEGLENVEISIISTIGQVVYFEKPGNISGRYQQSFDLSSEAAGVYLLRITTDEHIITRRVTLRR